jgi:hypothetical protein
MFYSNKPSVLQKCRKSQHRRPSVGHTARMAYGPYDRTRGFAFHEAGHAVVGHGCGGGVSSVSVGEHGTTDIYWSESDSDGELKCLWAGTTAEQTYENNCDPPATESDSWSGWAVDDAEINGICDGRLGDDANAISDLRQSMLEGGRKILGTNWKVVEKLAEKLQRETVISGGTLIQILCEIQSP